MCNNGPLTQQEFVLRDGMVFIAKTDHQWRITHNNFACFQASGGADGIGQVDAMPSAKATARIARTSEFGRVHAGSSARPVFGCRPLAVCLRGDATRLPVGRRI